MARGVMSLLGIPPGMCVGCVCDVTPENPPPQGWVCDVTPWGCSPWRVCVCVVTSPQGNTLWGAVTSPPGIPPWGEGG